MNSDKVKEYEVRNIDTGYVCAGTREDCWSYLTDSPKATRIAFGKSIENETHLILAPSIKKILACKNLDFIPLEITHLSIPLPLISLINSKSLPKLYSLEIENKEEYFDHFELNECSLDSNLKLKSLNFFGDCDKAGLFWKNTKINLSNYPHLEHVNLFIEDIDEIKSLLSTHSEIKHLFITIKKGTKIQNFTIPSYLTSLSISTNTETKLDFKLLENTNKLNSLYFRSKNLNTFDCKNLLCLKNIEELTFIGLKRLENPLELLEIQNLKQLKIIDCNTPFKKNDVNLFKQKNFKVLDIDYA